MSDHLERAAGFLQFADNELTRQLADVADELKRVRLAAVQVTVREIIREIRARPPS